MNNSLSFHEPPLQQPHTAGRTPSRQQETLLTLSLTRRRLTVDHTSTILGTVDLHCSTHTSFEFTQQTQWRCTRSVWPLVLAHHAVSHAPQ